MVWSADPALHAGAKLVSNSRNCCRVAHMLGASTAALTLMDVQPASLVSSWCPLWCVGILGVLHGLSLPVFVNPLGYFCGEDGQFCAHTTFDTDTLCVSVCFCYGCSTRLMQQ
jgi:hypothetical protein